MAGVQNCERCSAPLTLGAPGSVVRCAYCGTDNRIAGLTGVMPVASSPVASSPYARPETPSPYGAAPHSPYGPPGSVRHAPPVRAHPQARIIALVVLAVIFLPMGCGFLFFTGAAVLGGLAR